jgi:hypothetical protein
MRMTADDATTQPQRAGFRAVAHGDDPVPPEVLRAAREALTHRPSGSEVAALCGDSLDDDRSAGGPVRTTGRRLLFRTTSQDIAVAVVLEVTRDLGRCGLVGWLEPPGPEHIVVNHAEGRTLAVVDPAGRFAASDVPSGPMSLGCEAAGVTVETEWARI